MAYVDQNGSIMIDEIETAEDIKSLRAVLDILNDTLSKLNQIINVNSAFKGDTAEAIELSTSEIIKRVNQQKDEIEAEIQYINKIVEKYKTIDSNMKNQINSAVTGESIING